MDDALKELWTTRARRIIIYVILARIHRRTIQKKNLHNPDNHDGINTHLEWFQIEKEVHQGCMLSPCLFNLYAEYIMRNAGAGRSTSWNQDCWEKYQ